LFFHDHPNFSSIRSSLVTHPNTPITTPDEHHTNTKEKQINDVRVGNDIIINDIKDDTKNNDEMIRMYKMMLIVMKGMSWLQLMVLALFLYSHHNYNIGNNNNHQIPSLTIQQPSINTNLDALPLSSLQIITDDEQQNPLHMQHHLTNSIEQPTIPSQTLLTSQVLAEIEIDSTIQAQVTEFEKVVVGDDNVDFGVEANVGKSVHLHTHDQLLVQWKINNWDSTNSDSNRNSNGNSCLRWKPSLFGGQLQAIDCAHHQR